MRTPKTRGVFGSAVFCRTVFGVPAKAFFRDMFCLLRAFRETPHLPKNLLWGE